MEIENRTNIGTILYSGIYGSIIYVDVNSKVAQDNANFFFDDVNKRLGVGLNSPTSTIEVFGDFKAGNVGAGNYAAISQSGDLQLFGTADYLVANDRYAFRSQFNELIGLYFNGTSGRFEFLNNTGGVISWLNVSSSYTYFSNRVGVKVEAPATDLQVNGSAAFGNDAIDYVYVYSNGDLSLIGNADYLVQDNKYAFRSFSAQSAGLLFDNTNARFGFTTATGTDAFIKADGTGDGYFKGKLGLGTATPGEKLEVSGNVMTSADNNKYYAGAGKDMSIYYDGTAGNIKTSEVAASDLLVTCGANKTVELQNVVYNDINFNALSALPGAQSPSLLSINSTGIEGYSFNGNVTTNELQFGAEELLHGYKEGTDITLHFHWRPTNTNAGNVKWQAEIIWDDIDSTPGSSSTVSVVDAASGTAWQHLKTDEITISGSGKHIGSLFHLRVFRDPTDSADTYNSGAILSSVGFHYQIDTMGSRQVNTK